MMSRGRRIHLSKKMNQLALLVFAWKITSVAAHTADAC
jgi:hypothetical protein